MVRFLSIGCTQSVLFSIKFIIAAVNRMTKWNSEENSKMTFRGRVIRWCKRSSQANRELEQEANYSNHFSIAISLTPITAITVMKRGNIEYRCNRTHTIIERGTVWRQSCKVLYVRTIVSRNCECGWNIAYTARSPVVATLPVPAMEWKRVIHHKKHGVHQNSRKIVMFIVNIVKCMKGRNSRKIIIK